MALCLHRLQWCITNGPTWPCSQVHNILDLIDKSLKLVVLIKKKNYTNKTIRFNFYYIKKGDWPIFLSDLPDWLIKRYLSYSFFKFKKVALCNNFYMTSQPCKLWFKLVSSYQSMNIELIPTLLDCSRILATHLSKCFAEFQ